MDKHPSLNAPLHQFEFYFHLKNIIEKKKNKKQKQKQTNKQRMRNYISSLIHLTFVLTRDLLPLSTLGLSFIGFLSVTTSKTVGRSLIILNRRFLWGKKKRQTYMNASRIYDNARQNKPYKNTSKNSLRTST